MFKAKGSNDTDTDTDTSLFLQFNDKSNNQCTRFKINTNIFNVECHGDHIIYKNIHSCRYHMTT